MDEPNPPAQPLTPDARRLPGVPATEARLADGRPWALAAFVPTFGPAWDRLFDHNLVRGTYDEADVLQAAAQLLTAANDLTAREAAGLLWSVPVAALVPAVEAALLGPEPRHRTWSEWAAASLLANGVDPAAVPPAMLRPVLEMLEATGRIVPAGKFTSAGKAMGVRAGLLEMKAAQASRGR